MKEKRKKAQGVHGNEKVAERVKRRKKTKDLGVVVGINPKKKLNKKWRFFSVECS